MTVERIAGLPTAVNENLLYRLPQVLLLGIQCLYVHAIPSFLGPKPEAAVPASQSAFEIVRMLRNYLMFP